MPGNGKRFTAGDPRAGRPKGSANKATAAVREAIALFAENNVDKLQGWLERIKRLDFYGGGLAAEAAERLKGCERLLDAYAQRVFEAHDENR